MFLAINNVDFSDYCSELVVKTNHKYTSQTNAAGDTVVDYINKKKSLDIGIVCTTASVAQDLLEQINSFSVLVEYLEPESQEVDIITGIIDGSEVEYYTIQTGKTRLKAFRFTVNEL